MAQNNALVREIVYALFSGSVDTRSVRLSKSDALTIIDMFRVDTMTTYYDERTVVAAVQSAYAAGFLKGVDSQ